MPDQESPPGCTLVTGILTQMKSYASERTPKADLSALQPPVRSATSRHKKDSKKQILSDCLIEYVPVSARRVRA